MLDPLLKPIEGYLFAALAAALLVGGLWAIHHERDIGRQETTAAVEKARAEEHEKVVAETLRLQKLADKAEAERDAAQKKLDAYLDANPIGDVFVCHHTIRVPAGVSAATGADGGHAGAGTGPDAVGEVSGGSEVEAVNIGPELDTIVRSAGAMAGLYRQFQAQPKVKVK